MRLAAAVCLWAFGLAAQTQTMSVARLMEWLRQPATPHENDAALAAFLSKVKLTDRLDDKALESLRGVALFGPKTVEALHKLRDQSKNLPEPAGATGTPAMPMPAIPTAAEQAAIIDDARRYAMDYSEKLPNFICYERDHRWAAPARTAADPDWKTQDTIVKRVTFYQEKEEEKVLQHNNTFTTVDMKSLGGSQSIGDFGSMLRQIFDPRTAAVFEWGRWSRRDSQLLMTFTFRVPLERSQYRLEVEKQSILTAYHGSALLDAKSHAVLRISVEAENIPADFPLRSASDTVDYAMQTISGQSFLLPLRADVRMGAGDTITKNIKEFLNYSKYDASSTINFNDADLPPLPPESTDSKADPASPPAKKGGR